MKIWRISSNITKKQSNANIATKTALPPIDDATWQNIICTATYRKSDLVNILGKIKDVDINALIKTAINKFSFYYEFENFLCCPELNLAEFDAKKAIKYIIYHYNAQCDVYKKETFIKSIENALKVHNAYATKKYYQDNGELTIQQISKHIKDANCQRAINMPITNIGGNIGHLLAEMITDDKDLKKLKPYLKNLISELHQADFHFWEKDGIGRTPVMFALELGNYNIARAMLEEMTESEIRYREGGIYSYGISFKEDDTEVDLRDAINNLEPDKKEEFAKLLDERLNTEW